MKTSNKKLLLIAAIMFIGTVITLAGCGQSTEHAAVSQSKVVYHCPMHPTYTSDKPGDCPICGMKLVKKDNPGKANMPDQSMNRQAPAKEKLLSEVCIEHQCGMKNCPMMIKTHLKPGERLICPVCGEVIGTTSGKVVEIGAPSTPPGETSVMISPERQQMIGVKTEMVQMRDLTKTVRASGKIAYDPELVVTQEEFIQALIAQDNIKDSPLQDVIDRAKNLTQAARNKLKLLGMNEDQIDVLEKTRKADTNLYLPGKGENVWVYANVYEYEIGLIKVGDSVDIKAVAYPGEKFTGQVVSINPVLDPATRTNQVRVLAPNPDNKLKPEMFVTALIKESLGSKLAVPETAVLDTGLRKIVYLSEPNNVLESREVRLGSKAENYYEVLSGLKEGDVVVTSGNFLIDSESKLKSPSQG